MQKQFEINLSPLLGLGYTKNEANRAFSSSLLCGLGFVLQQFGGANERSNVGVLAFWRTKKKHLALEKIK